MDYEPNPSKFHLVQMSNSKGRGTDVTVTDERFTVPTEPRVYYYSYGGWMRR